MPHNFWMINCNKQNFDITQQLGFAQQGLKAEYRRKVQRVEPGDRIIYYVSGVRVFTATATVTKSYEEVKSTPWVKEGKTAWPYRIEIRPDVILPSEQYINAGLIAYRLEYLRKWPPENWHMAFQGNLHLLSKGDFFLLETEMLKLRDGRDAALRKVDEELAAENGAGQLSTRSSPSQYGAGIRSGQPDHGTGALRTSRNAQPRIPRPATKQRPQASPTSNQRAMVETAPTGVLGVLTAGAGNRRTPDNPVKYDND